MGSVRRHGDAVQVSLDRVEAGLLVSLIGQTGALLDDPAQSEDPLEQAFGVSSVPVDAPEDPLLRRLLPDGYRDDADAAAEFRRLTEADLRATKRVALHRMLETLEAHDPSRGAGSANLELDGDTATAWLHALADVRLALGTRLDVGEDIDAERSGVPAGSPRHAELSVYDWLSWLQDALVRAVWGD